MDCARAEELLSDDCEGTLDALFRDDLHSHLGSCAACRRLREELQGVVLDLRRPPELSLPEGLAERVAAAVVREHRLPRRRRPFVRFQAAAAVAAIAGSTLLFASRGPVLRQGTRLVERASNAGVYLLERKDRLLEDVRILRVVVGAAFEGRLDRVNDRVEDYRRLLERRRNSPEQKQNEAEPTAPGPVAQASAGDIQPNPGLSKLVKHPCG